MVVLGITKYAGKLAAKSLRAAAVTAVKTATYFGKRVPKDVAFAAAAAGPVARGAGYVALGGPISRIPFVGPIVGLGLGAGTIGVAASVLGGARSTPEQLAERDVRAAQEQGGGVQYGFTGRMRPEEVANIMNGSRVRRIGPNHNNAGNAALASHYR